MKTKILIYGATGYTGRQLAQALLAAQITPILAARGDAVTQMGLDLHCPSKVIALSDALGLRDALTDVQLLVNLAGPFSISQSTLIEACLATRTHYIDIAGEVAEMKTAFAFDQRARQAGILIIPGAGFGVVPTDIAAYHAAQRLPGATRLRIAYAIEGGASKGTLKTVLKDINRPGVVLEEGQFVTALPAADEMAFSVGGKQFHAVTNPWRADLVTAQISTGIATVQTYSQFPGLIVQMMRGRFLWLRDLLLNIALPLLPEGPSDTQLAKGRTYIQASASKANGQTVTMTVCGPDAYVFTTAVLVQIIKTISTKNVVAGTCTPSQFDPDLLTNIPGVTMQYLDLVADID